MNRLELIRATRDIIAKAGFYISEETDTRMICFDIVARRDNVLLIIKVLTNVDSFSKFNADQLLVISNLLKGVPILIGERTSQKAIEQGIIYLRHGLPMFNFQTLHDFLIDGVPPLIFSAPGGFYVNIDGDALRQAREAKDISLGRLAQVAGVSRKAIQMYESGMSTMIEIALRLEEFLDIPLIKPMNPFSLKERTKQIKIQIPKKDAIENDIFNHLRGLGYNVLPTIQCPFDALTNDSEVLILTGIGEVNQRFSEKAKMMTNLSKITERYSVIFLKKHINRSNLEGTPVIHISELEKMDDGEDVISLIAERR